MNTLIRQFGKQKRWVEYSLITRDGKTTKVPLGKSDDPSTWCTFNNLKNPEKAGIMFGLQKKFLGIDIDKCLNLDQEIDHEKKDEIESLIREAGTYCEISPSGTGLHLFLELDGPLDLIANKKAPFECYTHRRFFTVTQDPFGEELPVRKVSVAEAERLLALIGYPWKKNNDGLFRVYSPEQAYKAIAPMIDDQDLLKKMFSSKTGAKLKSLYDGDTSGQGGDTSNADAALCTSLAFWTQGDREQMRRLWLSSKLGAREKTQSRADYQDRTIDSAIANCTTFYEPTPAAKTKKVIADTDIKLLFTYAGDKKITTQCVENICRVLRKHPDFAGKYHYDAFKNTYEMNDNGKWREIEDNDIITLQTEIQILFDFFQKVGKDMVYDAIIKVAKENTVDSAVEYLQSLVWDKQPRLDQWLVHVYGTPDDEYHQKVGSNWMKGLVTRILYPGSKFDYVLVLEGEQGSRKSTSLSVLGGSWHVETTMSTDSKDFFMQFQGKAIVEFSEGETLNRTEVKRMKAIITTQSDKYRPPYERMSREFPRRCIFAMTTNQEEYLKDETGNRRWLPVRLEIASADIDWLRENRDQLFAEAYERVVVLKETNYEFPHEETLRQQNSRRVSDPNEELIAAWYASLGEYNRNEGITINQVWTSALNNGFINKLNKWDEMAVAGVLKDFLKLKKMREMKNGIRYTRWFPADYVRVLGLGLDELEGVEKKAISLDDF